MKYVIRGNVIQETVRRGNVHLGNCPFGELSFGELSVGEMPSGKGPSGKRPSGKSPFGRRPSGNCPNTLIRMLTSFISKYLCFIIRHSMGRGASGRCSSHATTPCKIRNFAKRGNFVLTASCLLVLTDNIQEGRLYDMPTMHGKMSASSRISRTYCSFVSRIHQVKNGFANNIRFKVPSKIQVFKNSLSAL